MINVNSKKCPKDHKCPMIRLCSAKAISQFGFDAPVVDNKKCIECLVCVNNCHYGVFEKS